MANPIDVKDAYILVAEDNKRALEQIEAWLIRFGYHNLVLTCSAKECIEKLSERFDIILLDMRMETAHSGFTILDAVQERNLTSAVIILTANDTVMDSRQAFRSGVWDYISKNQPGNFFKTLDASIREALTYRRDKIWLEGNMSELCKKYPGQYVAVLNESVMEAANSEAELNQRIKRLNLTIPPKVIQKIYAPFEGPLREELTVFVEGPTDVKYIQYAAKLLGKEILMNRIHLDTIGDQDGQKGNGYHGLNQGFNFLQNNPTYRPYKVLFLFDQDVTDRQIANKGEDIKNLFVRRIADPNPDKKGIEYLLAQTIHEEGFQHESEFVQKDLGRATRNNPTPTTTYVIKEQSKMRFCEWVCDERKNSRQDFAAFQPIFRLFENLLNDIEDTHGMA